MDCDANLVNNYHKRKKIREKDGKIINIFCIKVQNILSLLEYIQIVFQSIENIFSFEENMFFYEY